MSRRIHIVGRKNSGKTTLIAELVSHLTDLGYRVGTIKHTHHHHELDTPGKDSFRHREAGAAVVGIMAPQVTAVFQPASEPNMNVDRYSAIMPMFDQCDLLLVEGDFQTEAPKIEVWRTATHKQPMAMHGCSVLAIVTDDPINIRVPRRSRSDVARLARWVLGIAVQDPTPLKQAHAVLA